MTPRRIQNMVLPESCYCSGPHFPMCKTREHPHSLLPYFMHFSRRSGSLWDRDCPSPHQVHTGLCTTGPISWQCWSHDQLSTVREPWVNLQDDDSSPYGFGVRILSLSICFRNLPCPPKAAVILGWELSRGTKLAHKRLVNGTRSYLVHAKSQCEAQARTHQLWTRSLGWLCAGGWSQRPAASLGSEGFSHCLPGSAPACGRQTDRQTNTSPRNRSEKHSALHTKKLGCCQPSSSRQSSWFLTGSRTILPSSMTQNQQCSLRVGKKNVGLWPHSIFKGPEVMIRTFAVTHKPNSPGKGNSNENTLWAISLVHHFVYAILFGISEETQLHYSRRCYFSICISPRLNHTMQSRNTCFFNLYSLPYYHPSQY